MNLLGLFFPESWIVVDSNSRILRFYSPSQELQKNPIYCQIVFRDVRFNVTVPKEVQCTALASLPNHQERHVFVPVIGYKTPDKHESNIKKAIYKLLEVDNDITGYKNILFY